MKKPPLTPREQDILDYLKNRKNYRPPSMLSIAQHFGWKRNTYVAYVIKTLKVKGYLNSDGIPVNG